LFSDGNPLAISALETTVKPKVDRDGFIEVRKHLLKLASGFSGKVLIVHKQKSRRRNADHPPLRIRWNRNLGETGISAGSAIISVTASPTLFMLEPKPENKSPSANKQP
jgi:hypothetical protein